MAKETITIDLTIRLFFSLKKIISSSEKKLINYFVTNPDPLLTKGDVRDTTRHLLDFF